MTKERKNSGFTLIEILVAMAIVAIISGIVLVNVGKNDDRDVRLEADRVMTFIREAQNSALSGDSDVPLNSGQKICGFGVFEDLSKTNDLNAYYIRTTGINNPNEDCPTPEDNTSGSLIAGRFILLGNGVVFDHTADDPDVPLDVFFKVPSGKAILNDGEGGCATNSSFSTTLKKGSSSVFVKVECTGRIYIE